HLTCSPYLFLFPYTTLFRSTLFWFERVPEKVPPDFKKALCRLAFFGLKEKLNYRPIKALCRLPFFVRKSPGKVPPDFKKALCRLDRKSTRLNSSHQIISYAV